MSEAHLSTMSAESPSFLSHSEKTEDGEGTSRFNFQGCTELAPLHPKVSPVSLTKEVQ